MANTTNRIDYIIAARTTEAQAGLRAMGGAAQAAGTQVEKMTEEARAAGLVLDEVGTKSEKSSINLRRLGSAAGGTGRLLGNLGRNLSGASGAAGALAGGMQMLGPAFGQTTQQVLNASMIMQQFAGAGGMALNILGPVGIALAAGALLWKRYSDQLDAANKKMEEAAEAAREMQRIHEEIQRQRSVGGGLLEDVASQERVLSGASTQREEDRLRLIKQFMDTQTGQRQQLDQRFAEAKGGSPEQAALIEQYKKLNDAAADYADRTLAVREAQDRLAEGERKKAEAERDAARRSRELERDAARAAKEAEKLAKGLREFNEGAVAMQQNLAKTGADVRDLVQGAVDEIARAFEPTAMEAALRAGVRINQANKISGAIQGGAAFLGGGGFSGPLSALGPYGMAAGAAVDAISSLGAIGRAARDAARAALENGEITKAEFAAMREQGFVAVGVNEKLDEMIGSLRLGLKELPNLIADTFPYLVSSLIEALPDVLIASIVIGVPTAIKAIIGLLNPFSEGGGIFGALGRAGKGLIEGVADAIGGLFKGRRGRQSGGVIPEDGAYFLHAGEEIVRSNGVGSQAGMRASGAGGGITIHLQAPSLFPFLQTLDVATGPGGLREAY